MQKVSFNKEKKNYNKVLPLLLMGKCILRSLNGFFFFFAKCLNITFEKRASGVSIFCGFVIKFELGPSTMWCGPIVFSR